jgi:hypothetical protein
MMVSLHFDDECCLHFSHKQINCFFPIQTTDNIPVRQRKKECGRLWRLLDKATKLKYKDIDFLAQLPNPFGRGDGLGPDGGKSQASIKKARQSRFFQEAKTKLWSRKVMLDVSLTYFLCTFSENKLTLAFS